MCICVRAGTKGETGCGRTVPGLSTPNNTSDQRSTPGTWTGVGTKHVRPYRRPKGIVCAPSCICTVEKDCSEGLTHTHTHINTLKDLWSRQKRTVRGVVRKDTSSSKVIPESLESFVSFLPVRVCPTTLLRAVLGTTRSLRLAWFLHPVRGSFNKYSDVTYYLSVGFGKDLLILLLRGLRSFRSLLLTCKE